MLKKALAAIITVAALTSGFANAAAENQKFVTISIPCPEGTDYWVEDYQKFDSMLLRYKDSKKPIPLSEYYDGYMFATVPSENADKEVEMFLSEPLNFNDYNEEESYNFYAMQTLSRSGVINGDENGVANPLGIVTRAEATVMIMRLLGVDLIVKPDSGFSDVPSDAWYADTVARAKDYKIIRGDSDDTFSPDRSITREELTAMAARAVWTATSIKPAENTFVSEIDQNGFVKDAENVSDWAMSAYKLFDTRNLVDWVEAGKSEDGDTYYMSECRLNPKEYATRANTADILSVVKSDYFIYPSRAAIEYGFDKKMPVIDGSTSTYPFTEAIYRSLFINSSHHPQKPPKHSKSHVSYERLINKEIDAMIASVYPSSDILKLAEEKGVELELVPIAYDAMVFFTNADNPAKGLTSQQISDIYVDNKYSSWSELGGGDALLYPYARNYDSGSHAQMEKHFLHGKDINKKIRKETTSVDMANALTDVIDAKTDNPLGFGLGYSIYYYFFNMDPFYDTSTQLKLLEINGVYPTDETIADGSYPLSNNTYIVLHKDEPDGSPARNLIKFMHSELGQECVKAAGFGPLK